VKKNEKQIISKKYTHIELRDTVRTERWVMLSLDAT
jgi:hypothetical protein